MTRFIERQAGFSTWPGASRGSRRPNGARRSFARTGLGLNVPDGLVGDPVDSLAARGRWGGSPRGGGTRQWSAWESLRAHRARSAHFGQLFRSLSDHVYPSLQLLLQVGDIHLVRDAIGVADALHIAVLHHFLQTPQNRYAG
jgi:hypothetical protein